MVSNYEKMKQRMQEEFLKYDQDNMIKNFLIDADEDYLTFDFMGGICRIHRKTGFAECKYISDVFREADYNEAMTVYDLLCCQKPGAAPCGQFVNMQSISNMHSAAAPGSGSGFFRREALLFDHKNTALCTALEKLGGTIVDGGDVAAQIPVFCGLNLLFRFWNSDDEFTPEIQFLWDGNVLSFMHYETVWFANHILIGRICEIMEKQ